MGAFLVASVLFGSRRIFACHDGSLHEATWRGNVPIGGGWHSLVQYDIRFGALMNTPAIDVSARGMPYVTLGYFTAVWERLKQLGLPIHHVIAQAGLKPDDLDVVNRHVYTDKMEAVLAAACQLSGDEFFCLKAGQQIQPMHLGVLGHLLLSCRNPAELVELHTSYGRLVTNAYRVQYELDQHHCKGIWANKTREQRLSRHTIEFNLAAWGQLARSLVGVDIRPIRVEFPYPPPSDLSEYQKLFQCELVFNAPQVVVHFTPDLLAFPLKHTHSGMRTVLESEIKRQLQEMRTLKDHGADFTRRVRSAISSGIRQGEVSLDTTARAMNCSLRTLQRQLQSRHLCFRTLLDEERRTLADTYIADPTLCLADMAILLGFADQSTFQRAFRRWFGCTPRAKRLALLNRSALASTLPMVQTQAAVHPMP